MEGFFLQVCLLITGQRSLERNKTYVGGSGMYMGRHIWKYESHQWRQWLSNLKKKCLLSQTFLDCFTTRRKPYSQSLAQRSKRKGDFFQRFSRVWTVQLEMKCFVFYLMEFCKWKEACGVYLRGLCEFPVRRLDFGPYPSVCDCCSCCSVTVAPPPPPLSDAIWYHKSGSRMYRSESVTWSILIFSPQGDPVEKDTFVRLMYRALNHVVSTRNIWLPSDWMSLSTLCVYRILFLYGAITASTLGTQGLWLSLYLPTEWIRKGF